MYYKIYLAETVNLEKDHTMFNSLPAKDTFFESLQRAENIQKTIAEDTVILEFHSEIGKFCNTIRDCTNNKTYSYKKKPKGWYLKNE